eukprot:TRINITY_DN9182_c0_g1_i1.p1 TRINITY_DN9182_c0_g1~~TRINITY_DN9182_c0_g1_i1.p1  ORF type:complete len:152 (+),score=28.57 TRINITY_DN9182_c0_g1_i1:53-457(+)
MSWTTRNVAIKNCHGNFISWNPSGNCRANENKIGVEEKWLMSVSERGNSCKFGKPVGNGLYSYMSSDAAKYVNCKVSWPVGTEWIIERHGNKFAFKAIGGEYLTSAPKSHDEKEQVRANATAVQSWELFEISNV